MEADGAQSPPDAALVRLDGGEEAGPRTRRSGSGSPPSPLSPGVVSCVGCVDTSIPLVTAAERTAGPSGHEAQPTPSV